MLLALNEVNIIKLGDQMENLIFKDAKAAFYYAEKYFGREKPKVGRSFIGLVIEIDKRQDPEVYMVSILCNSGSIFNRKSTEIVAALKHPDLQIPVEIGDLIRFGLESNANEIPTGFLLQKYSLELDVASGQFKNYELPKYKVIVRDHFNYMREDENYEQGTYSTQEEAIEVCKSIIDDYLESRLDQGFDADELYMDYMRFVEDPTIENVFWSASSYAAAKAQELVKSSNLLGSKGDEVDANFETFNYLNTPTNSPDNDEYSRSNDKEIKTKLNEIPALVGEVNISLDLWQYEVRDRFGRLLPNSEILENEDYIFYKQTNQRKLIAAYNKKTKDPFVLFEDELPKNVSYSSPSKLNNLVFNDHKNNELYYEKQYLCEYLANGLRKGEIKTLTAKTFKNSQIEFSVDAKSWNTMLIGGKAGIEGICKYFAEDNEHEQYLNFAMVCNQWWVTIEYHFDDYEDFNVIEMSIKELGGYYSS